MHSIILALSLASHAAHANRLYSNSFGVPGNAVYDYVIVGGGTAGNTIAARLAEDPSVSVAVIEAGGFYEVENGNQSVVPAYSTSQSGSLPNTTQPLIDWGFKTTPQAGANNRSLHYAHGKTLGGASARNYMAYQRLVLVLHSCFLAEISQRNLWQLPSVGGSGWRSKLHL